MDMKKYMGCLIIILMLFGVVAGRARAASARFTPSLLLNYHWNDNIQAIDPDQVDPIAVQWIDYMIGLDAAFKAQNLSMSLGGAAGYSQYVATSQDLKKLVDLHLSDLNYLNLALRGNLEYLTASQAFDLDDQLKRNRIFSDIFGPQNSDFSDFYLYTDNLASAQWRFRTRSPFYGLFRYEFESTNFDKPKGDWTSKQGSSYQHHGYAKFAYKINPKAELGLDLQGGQRTYDDSIVKDQFGYERKVQVVDYDFYQALLDFTYKLSAKASLEAAAGAHVRQFFGKSNDTPDLKDYTLPIGRISYNQASKNQYGLTLAGEYSSNTYGINLYFNYWQVSGDFKYYIRKPFYLDFTGIYKQDTYNRENLDLENVWRHNRVDNVGIASIALVWDALRKAETPYLSFNLGYQFQNRDSSIDKAEDYVAAWPGLYTSYNTQVNTVAFQLIFNPSVLIGPR